MIRLHDYRKDSKILRTPGKTIEKADLDSPEFKDYLSGMKKILALDGVGLAAPQAGWGVNLFMLCIDENDKKIEPVVFMNAEILSSSKKQEKMEEGCLSFPGLYLPVKRPIEVTWRYTDLDWNTHEVTSSGFYARAVQHEIDHCHGKVFIDKVSTVLKIRVKKWLKASR